MSEKSHSWNAYYIVFNALLLGTVITVGLSYVDIGGLLTDGSEMGYMATKGFLPFVEVGHSANIIVGLIVAVIKAALVIWFFMHMDHEESINRLILGFSLVLLVFAFLMFSWDFVFSGMYHPTQALADLAGSALGTH